jgi:type IV pilus assembly protein PilY1
MTLAHAVVRKIALTGFVAFAVGIAAAPSMAQVVSDTIRQDIEVFFTETTNSTAYPNILFIVDTSQSMFTVEDAPDNSSGLGWNDPKWDDAGLGCDPTKYYWAAKNAPTPSCAAGAVGLTEAQFECDSWRGDVDSGGMSTHEVTQVAQEYQTGKWQTITQTPYRTVCKGDGDSPTPLGLNWNASGKNEILGGAYTFYRGDYLNYINSTGGAQKHRIDIALETIAQVVSNTQGIKVGLMRYGYDGDRVYSNPENATHCTVTPNPSEDSRSSNGAPVVFPVVALDGNTPLPGFRASPVAATGLPDSPILRQLRYQMGLDEKYQRMGWTVDGSVADASQPYQIVRGNGGACGGNPAIPLFTPGGRSPIGAAMHEAYLYYAGKQWDIKYGKNADLGSGFDYPSVEQSRNPGTEIYKSPIEQGCAKNFIILLSDGTTEQDNDIDGPIQRLPGFGSVMGTNRCDTDDYLDELGTPPPSMCVDDMAEYMLGSDLSTLPGLNNVITYAIGFKQQEGSAGDLLLKEVTSRGGGEYCNIQSAAELEACMAGFVRRILTDNTSFSAPAVTVNAFNRTQNLNDLYMSLFRPRESYRWIGNLKKYRLDPVDGDIVDADGNAAVDPATGFFLDGARSIWSEGEDGSNIAVGGAADKIDPANRNLYTNIGDTTDVVLNTGNDVASITDAATFGIVAGDKVDPGDTGSDDLTATHIINWMKGYDVADADGDGDVAEFRHDTCRFDGSNAQRCDSGMGDPLHGKPTTVIYGGTVTIPNVNDAAVFAITNDGFLHAINPSNGTELWSFVPGDQLNKMRDRFYDDELTPPDSVRDRGYGLDGNVRVYRIDRNRNGIIETGDKVYLFFGQRRGGGHYYALDVTSKTSPKLMWTRDYVSVGGGQSWSAPQPMLIRLEGDTTPTLALAIGGGYDDDEDQIAWVSPTGELGNRVFIVNALNGNLLWFAGGSGSGANLVLSEMNKPIPADIRVVDLTGDGLADRMYTADMGGRVWRFDIINGESGDDLVEGGLFATLGLGEAASKTDATQNRRFFYAPDVSIMQAGGRSFLNVAIGSGHRELPATDKTDPAVPKVGTDNWFYSIRDYNMFGAIDRDNYRQTTADSCSATPPTDGGPCHDVVWQDDARASLALVDITTSVPTMSGRGWKFNLAENGEKSLAESRTFQNGVYFTTYAPRIVEKTDEEIELLACAPKFGINKLYIVNAATGAAIADLDTSTEGVAGISDRVRELAQGSIAPEPVFIFPTPENEGDPAVPPVCLIGLENCGTGLLNPPVRTYWRQEGAN